MPIALPFALLVAIAPPLQEDPRLVELRSRLDTWPSDGTYEATGRNEFATVSREEHRAGLAHLEKLGELGFIGPELVTFPPPFAYYVDEPHRVVDIVASAVLTPLFTDVEHSYVCPLSGSLYAFRSFRDEEKSIHWEYLDGELTSRIVGEGGIFRLDIFFADLRADFARTGFYWERLTAKPDSEDVFHARLTASEVRLWDWSLNAPQRPMGCLQYAADLEAEVEFDDGGGWTIRHRWVDPLGFLVASTTLTSDTPDMQRLTYSERELRPGSDQVVVDKACSMVRTGGVEGVKASKDAFFAAPSASRDEARLDNETAVGADEGTALPPETHAEPNTTGRSDGHEVGAGSRRTLISWLAACGLFAGIVGIAIFRSSRGVAR